MAKTSFVSRLGSALLAFSGNSELRTPNSELVTKGSQWPFNRIPLVGGGAGGDKISRPYEQSAWVQRAIKEIAGPISAIPLKFRERDREIENEPWQNFWNQPVKNLPLPEFIEGSVGWLKLAGENFLILPLEFTMPFPDRAKAWPQIIFARPDAMRAEKSGTGELLAWIYTPRTGQHLRVAPEQVIQPKFWNPYDDLRGMSEYESARVATESDYLSGKFSLNLARANGDTGVIVTVKGGSVPDDTQQEQINNALRLKAQKSQRGEFSSLFIPGDLEVKDPLVRAPDAQFVAQRLENRHEIYIAFGVPPSMADVAASYSIGAASDRYLLIEKSCVPLSNKIAASISQIASLQAGREVEAYFDWSEHPVMQQVRRERIDAAVKLCGLGMPAKDASEYLDLNLPRYNGDDVGYISATLLPTDMAGLPPETDPALAEPTDPVKDALRAIKSLKVGRVTPPRAVRVTNSCGCSLNDCDLEIKARDAKEIKLWKSIIAGRRGTIAAYQSKFNRCLMLARAEVLRKIESHAPLESSELRTPNSELRNKAVAADFIFNLSNFENLFHASLRGVALDALQKSGDQVFAELGKDDPWKMPQAETVQFLKDRKNKLANVPKDVFDRINGKIQDGLNSGDSLKDIANAVRGEFNDLSKGRAMVIAQTETAAAYGFGRHEAMSRAGVQFKRWLTSGNSNVRAAHEQMNGNTVPIDEAFFVVGPDGQTDSIQHPGDPDGEPWNVINCHCVEIASATGPEFDEPIV